MSRITVRKAISELEKEGILEKKQGKGTFVTVPAIHRKLHAVNSYHHQAVKCVAPGVEVMAESEDGLVEALSVRNKSFAVGVQWHPEFSYKRSEESMKLVRAFINACDRYHR